MSDSYTFICTTCGNSYALDSRDWRCACGGLFELAPWLDLDPAQIDPAQPGLWRYRALLPIDPTWEPMTLGEGLTPLLPVDWEGQKILFKVESTSPTGSFKDRGTTVLATALRGMGIERVVDDSSGNAGASLAAYAARAGIACDICVPNTAAGPKLAQMEAHGAEVIQIKGRREYAALAAWAAAAHGAYYASHVYSPFFLAGIETVAYEIWEQLDRRAPGAVVLPVGNGTLFLGLYRGFDRLHRAGLIDHRPRLLATQAAACAPIHHAFHHGQETVEPVTVTPTVASGIAIGQPARGQEILAALRATSGTVVQVSEGALKETRNQLAQRGFYVEDTSAVAVAGLRELPEAQDTGPTVVVLTGHGLKIRYEP